MAFAICNEIFDAWDHARVFEFIAKLGYGGIELAPFTLGKTLPDISEETRHAIRELSDKTGVAVVGLHWLLAKTDGLAVNHPDASVRQRTADYLVALARLCDDLGGKILVFGSPKQRNVHPDQDYATAWRQTKETLLPALDACGARGLVFALEPLGDRETDFFITAAETRAFIEDMNHPALKLHLDVKAMVCETIPIPDIIAESKDVLAHFHANDASRKGPGMGDTDFLPIAAALHEIGYAGWVSVEAFDLGPGAEQTAESSIRYMTDVFNRVKAGDDFRAPG